MIYKQLSTLALALACTFTVDAADIGEPAPQFTLPTLQQNQPVALTAFSGKVIYLDFWASWCAPCRTSFPLLNALYSKLKAQGFEVIAVNLDEDKAKADQFIKEFPVGFTVLRDSKGEWADSYVVESMPTSFIIDKQGVVQHIHHGFSSADVTGLEQKITQLLSSAQPS
ncbi:MAG: TlpA disulfide reductase family protein [Methylovulum sp.]|nr:TlpA disulfide reductase family protein [Methylovulum sp.]